MKKQKNYSVVEITDSPFVEKKNHPHFGCVQIEGKRPFVHTVKRNVLTYQAKESYLYQSRGNLSVFQQIFLWFLDP